MNQKLDEALKKIEQSKSIISEAEEILAVLMQDDQVPSVEEPEPAKEPIADRINAMGVVEVEDKTPPRSDLECYMCGSKVYDNRPNKASGQYKATAPDFTCSNNTDCKGMVQGKERMLRKSWWLDSKDLPQEWIPTTIPHDPSKDYVDTTNKNREEEEYSPF